MERIIRCISCHEPIEISSPTEPGNEVEEIALDVACPYCDELNTIMWPENFPHVVAPVD